MPLDTLRRYFPAIAAALITAALLTAACGDSSDDAPPNRDPDIRGEITELTPGAGDTLGTLLIEGEIGQTAYNRASVRVDGDTRIFSVSEGELLSATFHDLLKNQVVEVWFEGPVAESDPVQARAGRIEIVGLVRYLSY
jgi:hypothetical protein